MEDNKTALQGLKVADFGWAIVTPVTAKYLANHGAEVIRLESSIRMDMTRTMAPYKDAKPGINRSCYNFWNDSKYGITLNLKHPRAREIAAKIVSWADVVVAGYPPGVMQSWGLDYRELVKIKSDIIMMCTTNLGLVGKYASQPGYGASMVSYSGLPYITGWPDRAPASLVALTDCITPFFAVTAILAALEYHKRTGKGQLIDLSQHEACIQYLTTQILDYTVNHRITERNGNKCHYAAPHGTYPCKGDNKWCSIVILNNDEWIRFCNTTDNQQWIEDPRFSTLQGRKQNEDELNSLIANWTAQLDAYQVMEILQAAGLAAGVVKAPNEIFEDPQLNYRKHFRLVKHDEIGEYQCEMPSFRLSETPGDIKKAAPCLGQDNEYVYTKILGLSDEQFIDLLTQGVFD